MRDLLATCEPRSRSSSPWSQSLCSRSAASSLASTLAFSWESALVRACQSPQDQRWPCRRRWDARLIVLALLAAPQCFPQCLEFSLHCRKRSLSQTKGLAEIRRLGCERVDDLHRSRGFVLASERRSDFCRVRFSFDGLGSVLCDARHDSEPNCHLGTLIRPCLGRAMYPPHVHHSLRNDASASARALRASMAWRALVASSNGRRPLHACIRVRSCRCQP